MTRIALFKIQLFFHTELHYIAVVKKNIGLENSTSGHDVKS